MKKKFLLCVLYLLGFILISAGLVLVVLPQFLWNSAEPIPLDVWIVDKTVAENNYSEHKGVMWALNYLKVVSPQSKEPFAYNQDYFGTFPESINHFSIKKLPGFEGETIQEENPDLIYLADTYGIYKSIRTEENSFANSPELLYGGLDVDEINYISSNLNRNNVLVGEYDIINHSNKEMLEDLFNITWSGYSGKYFRDLASYGDVPMSVIESYEASGEQWLFSGPGLVIMSKEDVVYVLTAQEHLQKKGFFFAFNDAYQSEFSVYKNIQFDGWFDIIKANPSTETIAEYSMNLTEKGDELFNELGLSTNIPAIVRSNNTQYTSYYFAGDFAQRASGEKNSYGYGYVKLRRILSFTSESDNSSFFWKAYIPLMEKIVGDVVHKKDDVPVSGADSSAEAYFPAIAESDGFSVLQNEEWVEFYARGVNIGSSLPGKWFTEFNRDEELYLNWFKEIVNMNANSIRVYTLLSPEFYSALAYFNQTNPQTPLWLYQEIWPEEEPLNGDYLAEAYDKAYKEEIRNVIDAVHGKAKIPQRLYRAYGIYSSDVSNYIAGYLVGRELEPEEVISTNERNQGYRFNGEYLYTEAQATPTESWLAMCCDYTVAYEAATYGWQHPVGIVSWPTLDPKEHDSEWNAIGDKDLQYNDKTQVDINNISIRDSFKAGFFGAYHIYPNYPDFMNNEISYNAYEDEEGRLRYGGYLKEFMEGHKKYPAIVAEFGLSTGMGNAHESPDGYNHGGMSEKEQGEGIVRMMKAIQKEGYAGAFIFEWADEWAKKTWTTEPYMIPYERNPIWHNAMDPEQNYGIIAMESDSIRSKSLIASGEGVLKSMRLYANETYLTIHIELAEKLSFEKEYLLIGIDTYDANKGERKYAKNIDVVAPSGMEFLIELKGERNASILVHPGYNITKGRYESYESSDGIFERMNMLINKEQITKSGETIKSIYSDVSVLKYGTLADNSHYQWVQEGTNVSIRIPWPLINFSDPSTMQVLNDERVVYAPLKDELKTATSEGILASALLVDAVSGQVLSTVGVDFAKPLERLRWDSWDIPSYSERKKESYDIIKDYFYLLSEE
ncbi:MAG: hypothetical protein EOM59_08080 [Clostridia bacterium]|nr:hypothetical protein [Clostridia bacterium]